LTSSFSLLFSLSWSCPHSCTFLSLCKHARCGKNQVRAIERETETETETKTEGGGVLDDVPGMSFALVYIYIYAYWDCISFHHAHLKAYTLPSSCLLIRTSSPLAALPITPSLRL
jgi:hypothetical protein